MTKTFSFNIKTTEFALCHLFLLAIIFRRVLCLGIFQVYCNTGLLFVIDASKIMFVPFCFPFET